jgi:hypothetical protein
MALKLSDIEPTDDPRFCRIRFVKTRPVHKAFTKIYGNASIWSPGRIIRMVELITRSLRQWTHDPDIKDRLWVFLARRAEAVHAVPQGETTRMVMAFGKKTRSTGSSARTIPCDQPVQSVPPYRQSDAD